MHELRLFTVGTVVTMRRNFQVSGFTLNDNGGNCRKEGDWVSGIEDVGHVVKFGRNSVGEIVVIVDWSTGDRAPVHPTNLTVVH